MKISAGTFWRSLLGFLVGLVVMCLLLFVVQVPILPSLSIFLAFFVGSPRKDGDSLKPIMSSVIVLGIIGFVMCVVNGIIAIAEYPKWGNVLGVAFYFIDGLVIAGTTATSISWAKEHDPRPAQPIQ